jgi:hypothetical protein
MVIWRDQRAAECVVQPFKPPPSFFFPTSPLNPPQQLVQPNPNPKLKLKPESSQIPIHPVQRKPFKKPEQGHETLQQDH